MTATTIKAQGTAGVNLTVATSDDGGDPALSLVNPSNTEGIEYSDDLVNPITGGRVMKFNPGAGAIGEIRINKASAVSQGASKIVIYFTGVPSADVVLEYFRTDAFQNGDLRFASTGALRLQHNGGLLTQAAAPPLNEWLVLDRHLGAGTTSSNGKHKMKSRRLDDLAALVGTELSATNLNTGVAGTNDFTSFRLGKHTSAPALAPFYIAQWTVDDGATDYISDGVITTPPVAAYTRNVTQVVNFSTSTDAVSLAANVFSGPAGFDNADISITGLTATFVDDAARVDDIVVDFTVTGPGGTDVERVTIPPGAGSTTIRRVGSLILIDGVLL